MSDRTVLVLSNQAVRAKATALIAASPDRTQVTFTGPKRSLPQNSRIWSGLNDLSKSLPYHGMRLSAEDWRTLLMDALWRETRMLPSLQDDGFVQMRKATSEMSVKEAEQFISLMYEFGYRHGVVFSVDAQDGVTA